MKKKLLCLLVAAVCLLPFVFTACGDDEEVAETGKRAMTLNLYGITNESTTEEAVAAVQEKMNEYTEGKFNTHIVLHLYTEDEYYDVIDAKLEEITRLKAEEAANKKNNGNKPSSTTAADSVVTDAETYEDENGVTKNVYPEEKATQLDIFMVQGATNLNKYNDGKYLSPLSESLANSSKILTKRISATLLAGATLGGRGNAQGLVNKGTVYGIPNNYVFGEYTYLLVKKDIADDYGYSADDVDDLEGLANFLDDAAKDYSDHITLYNEPKLSAQYLTETDSLIGAMVTNDKNGYSRLPPASLLNLVSYQNYMVSLKEFNDAGYITKGDDYSMPVDENGEPKKVAAAFIKGDASLPAQYEDEYFVITYEKPQAAAADRPGTMFCVSSYAVNVDRAMEIITALQTSDELRNTFQYGVENVHYEVDEYTGIVKMLNKDYSMNPEDTGNLFLLKTSTDMDAKMLKLAENDWALGKQQLNDTVVGPYCYFNFKVITEENYKTESYAYKALYDAALEAAKEEAKANGKKFDESKFEFDAEYEYRYTNEILDDLVKLSQETIAKIQNYEETVDENGEIVTLRDYIKTLRKEFEASAAYKEFSDTENPDAPRTQYLNWYEAAGIESSM